MINSNSVLASEFYLRWSMYSNYFTISLEHNGRQGTMWKDGVSKKQKEVRKESVRSEGREVRLKYFFYLKDKIVILVIYGSAEEHMEMQKEASVQQPSAVLL